MRRSLAGLSAAWLLVSCGGEAANVEPPLPFPGPVTLSRVSTPLCSFRELGRDRGVECLIVEASTANDAACAGPGRAALHSSYVAEARRQLAETAECDHVGTPACDRVSVCRIPELEGAARQACLDDPISAALATNATAGWCFLDDERSPLVADCEEGAKRRFLFVSPAGVLTPTEGAALFVACRGSL